MLDDSTDHIGVVTKRARARTLVPVVRRVCGAKAILQAWANSAYSDSHSSQIVPAALHANANGHCEGCSLLLA